MVWPLNLGSRGCCWRATSGGMWEAPFFNSKIAKQQVAGGLALPQRQQVFLYHAVCLSCSLSSGKINNSCLTGVTGLFYDPLKPLKI